MTPRSTPPEPLPAFCVHDDGYEHMAEVTMIDGDLMFTTCDYESAVLDDNKPHLSMGERLFAGFAIGCGFVLAIVFVVGVVGLVLELAT